MSSNVLKILRNKENFHFDNLKSVTGNFNLNFSVYKSNNLVHLSELDVTQPFEYVTDENFEKYYSQIIDTKNLPVKLNGSYKSLYSLMLAISSLNSNIFAIKNNILVLYDISDELYKKICSIAQPTK